MARPLLAPAMLHLGKQKHFQFPETFLLIHDGEVVPDLPKRRKVTRLDLTKHHLNPVSANHKKAREFVSILDAIFPEGQNTLTKKNASYVVLQALKTGSRLDTLLEDSADPAERDAYQKIETLLYSPVLKSFLCKPTNFSLDGIVIAKLDRTVLGEFDAFAIAQFLISAYKGTVVLPDFGFYGRDYHTYLIREGRLIAGVNYLEELSPKLRQAVLTMPVEGRGCLYEDALTLARYAGKIPGTNEHIDFIQGVMGA